jgi:transcription initiation factor TFIID subunit 10
MSEDKTERFLEELEEYNPAIPLELVDYYLKQSGFQSSDPKVKKLIALAGQKFISEICSDSMHFCKLR